jgi:cbb3-type cytochrome oxidase subunit 3
MILVLISANGSAAISENSLADFSAITTLATVIFAGIAILISILAFRKQDKKSRFYALAAVFTLLNTKEEREAR